MMDSALLPDSNLALRLHAMVQRPTTLENSSSEKRSRMTCEFLPGQVGRQSTSDDIRSTKPSQAALKTFAGGIGCSAIVAALIYMKRRKNDAPLGRSN